MKDSVIEWIGEIPNHWKISKLKFHGDILVGLSFDKEDISEDDKGTLVLRSSNVQEGKISFLDNIFVKTPIPNKLRVKEGDILICSRNGSRRLIGKNCLLGKEAINMTWGVFMTVFRSTSSEFFFWVLNSQLFKSQSGLYLTSTINQLTVSTLENLVFPYVPVKEEQKLISQYLDKKTKKIDSLIQKIKNKIELLNEEKTVLINQYVTKGLDPNIEMKDSGVAWIGQIPKNWEIKKIKYIGSIKSGEGITSAQLIENGQYPLFGGNGIIGFYNKYNINRTVILIGRVGEKCRNIHLVEKECFVSDNSLVLDLFDYQDNEWVSKCLCSRDLNKLRNQSSQPLITGSQVKNEFIPYPPLYERQEISKSIKKKTNELNELIELESKRNNLLKEYSQSLISSVVTGKIRITEEMI